MQKTVFKHRLANGLQILVRPTRTIPKVSVQLWYAVGSKDEATGSRGYAHLIEHMIFKGTNALSESDINEITHKLSGTCNAFTSYDYTGYLFDFPTQHWAAALPLVADCMSNCSFKEDFLTSEMKAVIQELKMYRDNYVSSLLEALMAAIFAGHPYQYPIIGYKHDLWSAHADSLRSFYRTHYVPNNATLVVVGDTTDQEVLEHATQWLGTLAPDLAYTRAEYPLYADISSKTVTLYRDITQSTLLVAFIVPGACKKRTVALDALAWILASGKGSRLHRKLVDELELVTDIDVYNYELFDAGLFIIQCEPKDVARIDDIIAIICQEIDCIADQGVLDTELQRAQKKTETDLLSLLESSQKQAYVIGKYFLATGDEHYLFDCFNMNRDTIAQEVIDLVRMYIRPPVAHVGTLLPLPEKEVAQWKIIQEASDAEDERILSARVRLTEIEDPVAALTISAQDPLPFAYPKHTVVDIETGLRLLYYNNANLPSIDIIISFKAKQYYDSKELQGLCAFVSALLAEGTQQYTATELAQELESYGMSLDLSPGYIALSMLATDFEKGLSFLQEVLCRPLFDSGAIERVRAQMLADVRSFWDDPLEFSSALVRDIVYKEHPYSRNKLGTVESISRITRDDIRTFYKNYISPQGARMAVVGDIGAYDVPGLVREYLSGFTGPVIADLQYPALTPVFPVEVIHPINRDQVVLCFAGVSVQRAHPDYDKLLIFDQIFAGGILGSMSSRLFRLREQSGLFYTIGGSLLANADEQPGIIFIRTIVSRDRLQEAEQAIKNTISQAIDTITQDEFEAARNALINSLVDSFESNRQMAATFLTLDRLRLPVNYFDVRAQDFLHITKEQVQDAARAILSVQKLAVVKVGRLGS